VLNLLALYPHKEKFMERKPEALQAAFFEVKSKIEKVKAFGIYPAMTIEEQDNLVEDLSTAKALKDGGKLADYRTGQAWYVESLIEFSAMNVQEQLDHSYTKKFAEQATETEMLDVLESM
jgi:hypothetical protein